MNPNLHLKTGRCSRAEGCKVVALPMFVFDFPQQGDDNIFKLQGMPRNIEVFSQSKQIHQKSFWTTKRTTKADDTICCKTRDTEPLMRVRGGCPFPVEGGHESMHGEEGECTVLMHILPHTS